MYKQCRSAVKPIRPSVIPVKTGMTILHVDCSPPLPVFDEVHNFAIPNTT